MHTYFNAIQRDFQSHVMSAFYLKMDRSLCQVGLPPTKDFSSQLVAPVPFLGIGKLGGCLGRHQLKGAPMSTATTF